MGICEPCWVQYFYWYYCSLLLLIRSPLFGYAFALLLYFLHVLLRLLLLSVSRRSSTRRKIRFWDMPTIKHTNKSWRTCSNCDSPLPPAPTAPWLHDLVLDIRLRFLQLAKAGGKPFVYFIIVGYLGAGCSCGSCSSFCIWSVAKTLKAKFI